MRFGRISVLRVELNCNSNESVLILGYWDVVMGLRAAFINVLLKMIVLRTRRNGPGNYAYAMEAARSGPGNGPVRPAMEAAYEGPGGNPEGNSHKQNSTAFSAKHLIARRSMSVIWCSSIRHRIGRALRDGEAPRKFWRLTKRE